MFLKWAGGKRRLAPQLVKLMPSSYVDYYEPFLGGGALFFHYPRPQARFSHLSDVNEDLINVYREVRDRPEDLMGYLDGMTQSKEYYYELREAFNWSKIRGFSQPAKMSINRAAMFLYLNKTCFNGLWRVNRNGEFNVPYRGNKAKLYNSDDILQASARLQNVRLRSGDFEAEATRAQRADFVYFDPPYDGTFSSYSATQFTRDDQRRLYDMACDLRAIGAYVMVSNAGTPWIRDLWKDWNIIDLKHTHSISAKASSRSKDAQEIVIRGW